MKLHWSPRSPFVRKVMIVLHETDLLSEVELVRSLVALHLPPNASVLTDNPLGKIPTLITDDGESLFDSRVICEYLDDKAGTGLFPSDKVERMAHLRCQALADGLTDMLLLWRTELTRESGPWVAITDGWLAKTRASMIRLEQEIQALADLPFGIGHISIICALGQLDFRWVDCEWRSHFPALSAFEDEFSERESISATVVVNDDVSVGDEPTKGCLWFPE